MNKIFIAPAAILFLLVGIIVSMSNMNVINLLVSGSDYGGGAGGSADLEAFDVTDNGRDDANTDGTGGITDSAVESLQSGLLGNGGSGSLNLLWLLQNAGNPDKSSYAYQLLDGYSKLNSGEYNNYTHHIHPEAVAGSHYNESSLASFVVPVTSGFGKVKTGSLGKVVNGKTLTLENAKKSDVSNPRGGTAVWKDSNVDGHPDGPFQIEEGSYPNSNANKQRTDGAYDLYNFVDAMNVTDSKYSSIASKVAESGATPDTRAIAALFGMYHNRGASGVGRMVFGLPYTINGEIKYSNFLKNQTLETMNPEQLTAALAFPKEFIKWFDNSNIPLENVVGSVEQTRALGALLVLANGGFFNANVGSATSKGMKKLPDAVINKLFPGQKASTIVNHINSKYIKKPWDVLGMSKSAYDKIYGSGPVNNQYEELYRFSTNWYNTVFYIDKKVTSDNYKAGNNVVVRAIEGIAAGYMIDVGVAGTYVLLEIALEAGIKSLTDGTVIDPSNPAAFYKSNGGTGGDTYNPAGAASGNFGKFLDGLGLTGKLSVTQQAQIQAMYEVSGGPYSQPKRGQKTSVGTLYMDCSAMATVGLYFAPEKKSYTYTGAIKDGLWLTSKDKTNPINGVTYSVKVVQINKSGQSMAESSKFDFGHTMKDFQWTPYLQTGDIVNGRVGSSGHVWTYLGKNTSTKTMVLTQDISRVSAAFSKYQPGEHFTMQASGYARSAGDDKMGIGPMSEKRGRDSSGKAYHAMRPIYNIGK